MNPYLDTVLGSTSALLNQNNQQQQSGALGTAIQSGAFGGDRTGLAAANLEQQQDLANANIYSGIASGAYNTALGAAQQQQGVNLSAGQANRAALGAAGQELAGIGSTAYGEGANTASEEGALASGAQTAGLQGAQAQIGAGTLEQQTQQAQDTAEYNQFLQQQSYPFQVDQFLANIAEGTGALSGSQTTTTQPGGFFSDVRLKHSIRKIGKTYDGQEIYSYKMHGDDRTHIGLIAQKVEKKHPEAVGLAGGYKIVDYGRATQDAANRGHFYEGGVVPIRAKKAAGGPSIVDAGDLSAILAAQRDMYAPMSGGAGVYGGVAGGVPRGGSSRVPAPTGATPHLVTAEGSLRSQPTGIQNVSGLAGLTKEGQGIYNDYQKAHATPTSSGVSPSPATASAPTQSAPWSLPGADFDGSGVAPDTTTETTTPQKRGGRIGLAAGGMPYSSGADPTELDIPDENAHNQLAKAPDLPKQAPSGLQQLMSMGSGSGGLGGMGSSLGGLFGGGGGGVAGDIGTDDSIFEDVGDAAAAESRGGLVGRRKRDAGGTDDLDAGSGDPNKGDEIDVAPPLQKAAPNTSLDSAMQVAKVAAPYVIEAFASKRGGRIGYDDGGDAAPAPDDTSTPAPTGGLKGWWENNKGYVLPALSGLAAMGTAPTKHLGVALAAGLGAGAGAYVPTQEGLAATSEIQARAKGQDIQNQIAALKAGVAKQAVGQLNKPTSQSPTATPAAAQAADDIDQTYRNRFAVAPYVGDENSRINAAQRADSILGTHLAAPEIAGQQRRIQSQTFANQNIAKHEADGLYAQATDPTASDADKQAALVKYNALHQWTGDTYESKDGRMVNSRTGAPPIGVATQTLTPMQENEASIAGLHTVDNGAPLKPTVFEMAAKNGVKLAGAPGNAIGSGGGGGGGDVVNPMSPPVKPSNPNTVGGAPVDPSYKLPADFSNRVAQTPEQEDQGKKMNDARKQFLEDNGALATSAQQGLMYTNAAQAIMSTHGNVAGLGAKAKADVSRALQAAGISSGVDATNYDILAKQLGNLAVQNFKSNFGARPAAKEFDVQMNTLNPDAKMSPDAISHLLDFNGKNFKYSTDTAHRAVEWDNKRGNPLKFFDWNNANFPQSQIVNAPARPGQQASGFVVGKSYKDKNGNSAVYQSDGTFK